MLRQYCTEPAKCAAWIRIASGFLSAVFFSCFFFCFVFVVVVVVVVVAVVLGGGGGLPYSTINLAVSLFFFLPFLIGVVFNMGKRLLFSTFVVFVFYKYDCGTVKALLEYCWVFVVF